jgi:methylenetetrahydrofolate reductase (NADPH)
MSRPAKTFAGSIRDGRLAISAELSLKRESSASDIRYQAGLFNSKVDALQVNDNPLAWLHMSAVSASSLLLCEGMDAVPILSCRDRNRIALHADLLGLRALGVSSVILTRGRRVGKKNALHASTVFDMVGSELIAVAAAMNEDELLKNAENLLIGTGAKAYRPHKGWSADQLDTRAKAGAEFMQTQLCMNVDLLKNWMQRLVEARLTWKYSIIVTLTCLPSAKSARWVKENISDSKIPKGVIERLEQASDPEKEGIAICAEKMREISEIPGVSGINLISMGNPEQLAAAIDESGLR